MTPFLEVSPVFKIIWNDKGTQTNLENNFVLKIFAWRILIKQMWENQPMDSEKQSAPVGEV